MGDIHKVGFQGDYRNSKCDKDPRFIQKGNSLFCSCVCSLPSPPFLKLSGWGKEMKKGFSEGDGKASLESWLSSSSWSSQRHQQQLAGYLETSNSPLPYSLDLSVFPSQQSLQLKQNICKSSNRPNSRSETRTHPGGKGLPFLSKSRYSTFAYRKRIRGICFTYLTPELFVHKLW